MQSYKDFRPGRGKWGPQHLQPKPRTRKRTKRTRKTRSSDDAYVKCFIPSDELTSMTSPERNNHDPHNHDQVSIVTSDRTSIHLEQHKRPSSTTTADADAQNHHFCQYSSATTIAEVKVARHSRRYLATMGDQSISGRRRLRQPPPVDGDVVSVVLSKQNNAMISDGVTPPPSAASSTAATRHRQQPSSTSTTMIEEPTKTLKHQLPPSQLSSAFLRLHAREKTTHSTQQKTTRSNKNTIRTTAKPRNNLRGSLELPNVPKWKQMLTYPSGVERRVATPLSLPAFGSITEREAYDQSLSEWEVLSRLRIVAREQNKKHQSWLVANNCTYIERLEHARAYYKKTTRRSRLQQWYRKVRYLKGGQKIKQWRLRMLSVFGIAPWKKCTQLVKQERNEHYKKYVLRVQRWWKASAQSRRYVRRVDLGSLVQQVVQEKVVGPVHSAWEKKLKALVIVVFVGKFRWRDSFQFHRNVLRNTIKKSLVHWHNWALKEKTIRRHLYFTSRASHGLMCSEIKRYAARARQRRRVTAATVIQCKVRCYNAAILLDQYRHQHTRVLKICAKFGLATNDSLLMFHFQGWKRVAHVQRTTKRIMKRMMGSLTELVFQAWSIDAMKQFHKEKVHIVTTLQAYYRGRAARNKYEVQQRQMQYDKAAQERQNIRNKLLVRNGGQMKTDSTNSGNDDARGYFSDSSDEDPTNPDNDTEVNLNIVEEFGQDTTTLKNRVQRYRLIQSELERMSSTLARFDAMYKQAREYVMELGYEMKSIRKTLHEQREILKEHQMVIKKVLRERATNTNQYALTDADMAKDQRLSKKIKHYRKHEDSLLKGIHEWEDKERHLQSKYVEEHRAMSDEKQNSAVYFDTVALSWNTNDAGGKGENEGKESEEGSSTELLNHSVASTPTAQRFPMRTDKQRAFLKGALEQALLYNGEKIRMERKRLKVESKILRRKQRALERDCLQQLLWLSVRNDETNAANGGGGGDGGQLNTSPTRGNVPPTGSSFKFERMLSDKDPQKTSEKVRKACLEWRNLLKDGWLPATKVAGWISGGLLDPSIPLRSRVVAFRCVRECFGEEEQVMAEIAYQLIAMSKQSDTKK